MRPDGKALRWALLLAIAGAVALVSVLSAAGDEPVKKKEVRMPASSTLVIYYSRTGTTKTVAEAIAKSTGADLERIEDTVNRAGATGFLRSLWDAGRKSETKLQPLGVDPAAYRLVIVGTPDWGSSVSAPVRTFLKAQQGRLPEVAFFLTDGTKDHTAVFRDMAVLAGREPVATLGIPQAEVVAGRYAEPVERFVKSLPPQQPAPAVRQPAPANL